MVQDINPAAVAAEATAMSKDVARVKALRAALPKLGAKDAEFGKSLLGQFDKKGSLSEKQWPWVSKLIERASPKIVAAEAAIIAKGAFEAFGRVTKEGAALPRVFVAQDGYTLQIKPAPDHGKNAGSLYVYMAAGSTKKRGAYAGCLRSNDTLRIALLDPAEREVLVDALRNFGHDCIEVMKATGHAIGCCANCGRQLTDPRSVGLGIGPICAEYLGLHDQWLAAAPAPAA